MQTETEMTLDRRTSIDRYSKNPFLAEAVAEVKIGYKTMTFGTGNVVINEETNKVEGVAAFKQRKIVDRSKFLMLYEKMQAFFWQLSPRAQKALRVIYHEAQYNAIQKDELYLNWDVAAEVIEKENIKMGRATYFRAINELVEKKVIAQSVRPHIYYLNPTLIFNGNRATFIQEIVTEDPSIEDEAYKLVAERALEAHRDLSGGDSEKITDDIKKRKNSDGR